MPARDPGPIRVLLVEQHAVLSGEVEHALRTDPSLAVVRATSALEATRLARAQPPTLALCETTLGEPGAVELARFFRLSLPAVVVVFVTAAFSEEELFEAARVGASAYLRGNLERHAFLSALRRAAGGEFLVDEEVMRRPLVASRILSHFRLRPGVGDGLAANESLPPPGLAPRAAPNALAPLFVPLSPRELEIIDLIARGNSNKLIARQLGISDQTVKNHITAILRKLEVNDRTEAVVFALRNGWIRIDAPGVARR